MWQIDQQLCYIQITCLPICKVHNYLQKMRRRGPSWQCSNRWFLISHICQPSFATPCQPPHLLTSSMIAATLTSIMRQNYPHPPCLFGRNIGIIFFNRCSGLVHQSSATYCFCTWLVVDGQGDTPQVSNDVREVKCTLFMSSSPSHFLNVSSPYDPVSPFFVGSIQFQLTCSN